MNNVGTLCNKVAKLEKKVAKLESKIDFYETEFKNLNALLKKCGFFEGIKTLKETAMELLKDYPEIVEDQELNY